MSAIIMDSKASTELKRILSEKNIESTSVRLFMSGMGWSGPSFNLALDEQKEEDLVEEIDGFTMLLEKDLKDQFGSFEVQYFEQNGATGVFVQPQSPIGGNDDSPCSSCSGCN